MLGDVDAAALGRCDYHEHLFQASPLLAGDELDDEGAARAEAASLRSSGFGGMVDATPIGLGRSPEAVARISADAGLAIVHVTGAHRAEHYRDDHPLRSLGAAALAGVFTAEVTVGIRSAGRVALAPSGAPIRAGLVKAGIGYWRIAAFERAVLDAAAETATTTGVGVMVHLEHGSAAHEVLDLLAAHGVPADRVILAHLDRNLDPGLHAELAARGAYLGYDGMARSVRAPDSAIIDCAESVVSSGGAGRLLLGGDVARRARFVAYGGMPGLRYLGDRFVPRLVVRLGPAVVDLVLRENPRRVLALRPPGSGALLTPAPSGVDVDVDALG